MINSIKINRNYFYNLYGRRIQKTVNGIVTNFLWDEDNISLEYTDNNQPCQEALISTHWIGAYSDGTGDSQGDALCWLKADINGYSSTYPIG